MLLKYYHIAKNLIYNFKCFETYYLPKESKTRVDLFSKLANTKKNGHLKTIIQETLWTPIIDIEEVMAKEGEEPNWMTPYKNFLSQGVLASDENKAQCLKWKAS